MSAHDSGNLSTVSGARAAAAWVFEKISGQSSPKSPPSGPMRIVNPAEGPPTGWGPPNEQQFQSGHTNNLRTNQSAELGEGVGPERKAGGHYPHAEQPNPFRLLNARQRSGGDAYSPDVYRPEVVAYWANALAYEDQAAGTRQRQGVPVVADQPPSASYTTTAPHVRPGGY